MNFLEAIEAQIAGDRVRFAELVQIDYVDQTYRLWNGFGPLVAGGQTWEGLAGIGSIEGNAQVINTGAPPLSLSVSGVDSRFAAGARLNKSLWFYRPVTIYGQFFDGDWQPLGSPFATRLARITDVKVRRQQSGDGPVYTVAIEAESYFATRRRPRYGYITDRDQQARFPGDRGAERVQGIDGKNVIFPDN